MRTCHVIVCGWQLIQVVVNFEALVAYEYIITISQEVKLIWWRKWTCATWIFMANRYLMIAIMVLDVSHISTEVRVYVSRWSSRLTVYRGTFNSRGIIMCAPRLPLRIAHFSCTNRVILGDTLVIAQYITFAGRYYILFESLSLLLKLISGS